MTEKAKRVMLSRAVATVLAASLVPSVAAAQLADTITPPAVVQEAEVQQTEQTLEAAAEEKELQQVQEVRQEAAALAAEGSLQTKIDNAVKGQVTTLTLQGETSEDLTIPAGKIIVLNLAEGSKLTNVSGHTITNNGTLTIEGTGTVDCTTHAKGAVNNNGTLTISGGTITRSVDVPKTNSWYVVNNAENATMIIDGGEIIGNSTYSSCIRNLGNATVSGGTIRQDKMIAMKNDDTGTLTVTGGKIISEDQAIQNWKTAEIEGGEIEGNVYTWAYVEKGTEFAGETTISGGKVTGDVAAVN